MIVSFVFPDPALSVCPKHALTCCTRAAESAVAKRASENFQQSAAAADVARKMAATAAKVDDFFLDLLSKSHDELHSRFTRTYGVLYERNAGLFRSLYQRTREAYVK